VLWLSRVLRNWLTRSNDANAFRKVSLAQVHNKKTRVTCTMTSFAIRTPCFSVSVHIVIDEAKQTIRFELDDNIGHSWTLDLSRSMAILSKLYANAGGKDTNVLQCIASNILVYIQSMMHLYGPQTSEYFAYIRKQAQEDQLDTTTFEGCLIKFAAQVVHNTSIATVRRPISYDAVPLVLQ